MLPDAVHEAGHAVAALALGFHVRSMELFENGGLTQTTDGPELGMPPSAADDAADSTLHAALVQTQDLDLRAKVVECFRATYPDKWLLRRVVVSVVGRTAEARFSGQVNYYGASADEESEEIMLDALRDQRWPWRWRAHCRQEGERLVDENWPAILRLATVLEERGQLDSAQVVTTMAGSGNGTAG